MWAENYLVKLVCILTLTLADFCLGSPETAKIHPAVVKHVEEGKAPTVIIYSVHPNSGNLVNNAISKITRIRTEAEVASEKEEVMDRRLTGVMRGLVNTVIQAVATVIKILDSAGVPYTVLWLLYPFQVVVYQVRDLGLLWKLASLDIVIKIGPDQVVEKGTPSAAREWPPTGNSTWNTGLIDARCKNITDNNFLGNGVTVGIIDTGVNYRHQELLGKWVGGDYGWLNGTSPVTLDGTPSDADGRGTGVAGIILGDEIGIAPFAKYLACQVCTTTAGSTVCSVAALQVCAQFVLCPWQYNDATPDKKSKDCSKRPKVVIYSGGQPAGGQLFDSQLFYLYDFIKMWNAMGIISVFSMGDYGSLCNSGNIMGNFEIALGVGAVDATGIVWDKSSRGPTLIMKSLSKNSTATGTCKKDWAFIGDPDECTGPTNDFCELIKPDLVAPGVEIYTTWAGNDAAYNTVSGTGYAAAHVAGVIALMISTNPRYPWNYQNVYKLLTGNTDRSLCNLQGANGNSQQKQVAETNLLCNLIMSGICGKYTAFPNNLYGWGLVWACGAVTAAANLSTEP